MGYFYRLSLGARTLHARPEAVLEACIAGNQWMAITGKPLAATEGVITFQKGGNAMDAACASSLPHAYHVACLKLGRRNAST